MKMTKRIAALALAASATLATGLATSVIAAETNATATSTAAKATTQKSSAAKTSAKKTKAPATIPWASLTANQKSVLSIGERVWTLIPIEKQKSYMATADNWNKTSAEDQKKLLSELAAYRDNNKSYVPPKQ